MPFDALAPLPGPPDPWAPSSMPALRGGPPYAMTDMIAAEPALAERIAARLAADPRAEAVAASIRKAAADGKPILTTGCGTSEHAAMVAAAILRQALAAAGLRADRVASVQAFELVAPSEGLVLAVSHEGGTAATNAALERSRAAGATTVLLTVGGGSPGAALADDLLLTGEQDQSWCHTVGYVSPMVAAAVLGGMVAGDPVSPIAIRALLDAADHAPSAERIATALASCSRIVSVGSGLDHASARELALKVEEGAHLPAQALQLETILHGHLAAMDARTGLVLVLTDAEARGTELLDRALTVLRAAAALGMSAAGILAADLGDDVPLDLTPAGRSAVPVAHDLPRSVVAALGTAIPLQLTAERLARARGINPDPIGRDDPRQAAAARA
ncbi:MAG TPA: SIS domain-containing protein [Candidatus Limnocylindria bacterium]